jgi:uncharacterized membrane protein
VTVPSLADEGAHADPTLAPAAGPGDPGQPIPSAESPAEGEVGSLEETKVCPMCGETIKKAATRCRFCGETLDGQMISDGVPTRIEAGDALSRAWEIYKDQLGLLIGGILIFGAIQIGMNMATQAVQGGIQFAVMGGGPPANPGPAMAAVLGSSLIFAALQFCVTSYLEAGYHVMLLKVARGQNPEIADIFSGRRYFWRFVLGNFLFSLMLYPAFLLLIIPGIFVILAFWPFMFIIVDRDVGVIEAFRRSTELTSGNYGTSFLLCLVFIGLFLVGLAAICLGLIFAIPLGNLMFAVAYCLMSGQAVATPRRS